MRLDPAEQGTAAVGRGRDGKQVLMLSTGALMGAALVLLTLYLLAMLVLSLL